MRTLIEPDNLYHTVCHAADLLFQGNSLSETEVDALVAFILANTHPHKGFLFFPTPAVRAAGIRLVTGEKPRTLLLANNAVELETLRLLALLRPDLPAVRQVLNQANLRLEKQCFASVCLVGECAAASIAYLRYLTALGVEAHRARIDHGLASLKQDRSGNGKWRRFPTRFTRRWLEELPRQLSAAELEYSQPERAQSTEESHHDFIIHP